MIDIYYYVMTGPIIFYSICFIAGNDYVNSTFTLTYPPTANTLRLCFNVTIINDSDVEMAEQFIVKLVSASPEGEFIEDTTCITIIDNDRKLELDNAAFFGAKVISCCIESYYKN